MNNIVHILYTRVKVASFENFEYNDKTLFFS